MSVLILLFILTVGFGILIIEIRDIEFQPFTEGLLIFTGSISILFMLYHRLKKMSSAQILFSFSGIFLGTLTGFLLSLPLLILSSNLKPVAFFIITGFGYACGIFGLKKAEKIKITDLLTIIKKESLWEEPKVLDTNVLIDGRVADLVELGFIKGTILIPRFVLREIQYIADSPDPLRRAKGKRALDILQRIQRAERVKFEIVEQDIPEIKEVDIKLIELTRGLKGTLITNDLNLIKIAQLRGVPVLNLNELAQTMRPPVLPGEVLNLFIVKEGKEADQGVAYLDDGTMVVVEGGRQYIGKTIEVLIHSVLQTGTGRMIFGKPKADSHDDSDE
ncbi:MAG: TRAM domain-containing protein [Thermodesulfovibrio sp.]|nr:TRAM domain-containing protein [Thermodesulfovibrio sp.]